MLRLLARGLPIASLRDSTTDLIIAALGIYGERVAATACDFYDETLALAGVEGVQPVMPSGIFSHDEIDRISRYQVGKVLKGDEEGFATQVAYDVGSLVYQTNIRTAFYQAGLGVNGNEPRGLQMTGQTAYVPWARPHDSQYEIRWQRIPQGIETCDFCLMLASRGAVYLTEESAHGHSEYDPNHVHRGCDCICVSVPCHNEGGELIQDVTFEGYDTGEMYELWGEWKQVTAKYTGKGMGTKEMRERMHQEKLDLMERRFGRRDWTY